MTKSDANKIESPYARPDSYTQNVTCKHCGHEFVATESEIKMTPYEEFAFCPVATCTYGSALPRELPSIVRQRILSKGKESYGVLVTCYCKTKFVPLERTHKLEYTFRLSDLCWALFCCGCCCTFSRHGLPGQYELCVGEYFEREYHCRDCHCRIGISNWKIPTVVRQRLEHSKYTK
jgi:hypothetical protein